MKHEPATMKPEEELLESVRRGDQEKVRRLLDEGVDFRYGNNAALREAALLKNQTIGWMLLRKFMADEAGQDARATVQSLVESAELLQRWHVLVTLRGSGEFLEL